jgi:ATP-binding cassette subfamily B multidrug efflux pump
MLWSDELLGPGAAAAALAMAFRVMGVSHWIMYEMASLFENIGTVRDGLKMFARRQAVVDHLDARDLAVKTGEIRFDQVWFAYSETQSVLENFDLVIRPGEKVGLVGPSGAGKSTLTNLMLRLYDIQGGRILIDGQDIAQVSQTSLRAAIGMVTQDTSLLHRSVRENLLYGRPSATDEEVRRAIQKAHADSFIDDLKDLSGRSGIDAHVGERGVKLSGGQRQRIAIARVILKNAPILVLDEATSALDSEIEAAIQESLVDLMEGKTVVAIAHRLSTIAAMDRLIVMDHGMIVEQGTHQELLAKGGLYARLWDRQVGGFLASSIDSNN